MMYTNMQTGLIELLNKMMETPYIYSIINHQELNSDREAQTLYLKQITYLLSTSISELVKNSSSFSSDSTYDFIQNFMKKKLEELKETTVLDDFNRKLDDKLYILRLRHEIICEDPVIQFIYWAIKHMSSLLIPADTNFIMYDAHLLIRTYFSMIIKVIENLSQDNNLTSKQIRNYLASNFIDQLILSPLFATSQEI